MKTFEAVISMVAEDVDVHECLLEGRDEFDVFQQIKDCNWFHYENKGHNFIQVSNIADIKIREVVFDD